MRLRLGAALLAAGLLLPMGCDAGSSDPEPKASPTPAATSGPDSEHLLVHGTVTRGDDPVSGATVELTLFPEDDSDLEEGEPVDTFSTPRVETDKDGHYAIELDPDELSSTYFSGKYLNFDINISVDGGFGLWSSTVWLKRNQYWRSDDQALVGDSVLDMSFDLGGLTITLTDSYGESETSDFPLVGTQSPAP